VVDGHRDPALVGMKRSSWNLIAESGAFSGMLPIEKVWCGRCAVDGAFGIQLKIRTRLPDPVAGTCQSFQAGHPPFTTGHSPGRHRMLNRRLPMKDHLQTLFSPPNDRQRSLRTARGHGGSPCSRRRQLA
jgi:hypothetical protein